MSENDQSVHEGSFEKRVQKKKQEKCPGKRGTTTKEESAIFFEKLLPITTHEKSPTWKKGGEGATPEKKGEGRGETGELGRENAAFRRLGNDCYEDKLSGR